jgi:Fe-S oxidoreductase
MEQQDLREWEARCIQEEPPACRAGCPLGVDGRSFAQAMAKEDLPAARAILEKSMPLAGVVARVCEAPCEQYCVRKTLGGAVALGALERYCVETVPAKGKTLRLPARPKKVIIIGGGPSSLTVAFDLAKKGYPVSLYHLDDEPGAWLRLLPEEELPAAVLHEELQRLVTLGISFIQVNRLDGDACNVEAADAVYVGLDDSISSDFAAMLGVPAPKTLALEMSGWFSGGLCAEEHEYRFITDVSEGREAAVSIDRFLQGASLTASRVELRHGKTRLYTRTENIAFLQHILPADGVDYSPEEARQEAARCIDCQCLECVRHCVYLHEFSGYPKSYARRIYNNSAIVKGSHQANTFINSCSLCGQCETLCPNDFSMADLCLQARQTMVREDRMPPSAHWFALEEMRSAITEGALALHAPGLIESEVLFFPGCQLAGIRPRQTLRLYDHLLQLNPKTGIWLDCCAAPAHWAGRENEFSDIIATLKESWTALGRPKVITACSTCLKMFGEYLSEIPLESVWTVLVESSVIEQKGALVDVQKMNSALALSDPCTARHDTKTQTAVRTLLAQLGQPLAPLPLSGELTECCGFGGLMESANPKLAQKVVRARVAQTDEPMLTYCAMCRDQLARTGKSVSHILDLLFVDIAHTASELPAPISERRVNRRILKSTLLARYPDHDLPEKEPWEDIELLITEPVAATLEERRILTDDIRQVLFQTVKSGSFFVHEETGMKVASAVLGQVTFWVQYFEEGSVFRIEKCWSHRMTIERGRV